MNILDFFGQWKFLRIALLIPLLLHVFDTAAQNKNKKKCKWAISTPEQQGLSSVELNKMFEYIKLNKTRVHSIQVLRHGRLVLDSYFYPYTGQTKHDIASVTKSITSTLIGIAIDKKFIPGINSNLFNYFPEYKTGDSLKLQITLEDLITMRSGFNCGADLSDPQINLDKRLAEIRLCTDWIKCILNIPMLSKPGERFAYCNANCHLLSDVIYRTTGMSLEAFANNELFKPLAIKDYYWPSDPKGINYGWADLQVHPYDMLKIGELLLHHGKAGEKTIISNNWLDSATKIHVTNTGGSDQYGYFWWLPGGEYPDVFEAVGRGGQRITIWPSKDIVIVFTGGGFNTSDLVPFIVKAIKSDNAIKPDAYSYSHLKLNVERALKSSVISTTANTKPLMANVVSGKQYQLQNNSLGLQAIQFSFIESNSASMNMIWAGKKVNCLIGLDGKERFSENPLVKLPQACKGKWIDNTVFLVDLDLVGGINDYKIKYQFLEGGQKVNISLSEGTGLNNEIFTGELLR